MNSSNWRFFGVHLTLAASLLLAVMPLPAWANLARPDWPLLVLCYWVLALPHRVNIGTAFFMGFLVDVMVGTVLGVNAAGYAIVAYVLADHHQKIRNSAILQQTIPIGLLLAFYHLFIFWLSRFLTDVSFRGAYLWPVFTGMLLWPYVFMLLRRYRRKLKIH